MNQKGDLIFSGTLEATHVTIRALTPGLITDVAPEGIHVRRGEGVASVDTTDVILVRAARQAQVAIAEAQLKLLERGTREEDITAAAQALTSARAALKGAEDDMRRVSSLNEVNSATQKQRDDAEMRYTIALATTRQAEEMLRKLRNGPLPEEEEAALARLKGALSDLAIAEKAVADCRLTAPFDAVVTETLVEPGDLVQRYGAILVLSKLDPIKMTIYVPENQLGRIQLGQPVKVTIDTFPDRFFTGRVISIAPEAEFTPKNVQTQDERVRLVFEVRIEIPNADGTLKPGLPADARIEGSG
ncbi:MAG: efflux RND transporter periplasmic adaptor subunit [Candidatus Latescibacteria bacterium]|nr:efflux RND transporter periplasmic adaptor subunit [Candidatus Latescibacterota bacterium]